MMERFKTLIKNDNNLGEKEYVQGQISGFQEVICNQLNKGLGGLANYDTGNGLVLNTVCSEKVYEKFVEFTESRYPGVCTFYYKD